MTPKVNISRLENLHVALKALVVVEAEESVTITLKAGIPRLIQRATKPEIDASRKDRKIFLNNMQADVMEELGMDAHKNYLQDAFVKFGKVTLRRGPITVRDLLDAMEKLLSKISIIKSGIDASKITNQLNDAAPMEALVAKRRLHEGIVNGLDRLLNEVDNWENKEAEGSAWQLGAVSSLNEIYVGLQFPCALCQIPLESAHKQLKYSIRTALVSISNFDLTSERQKKYSEDIQNGQKTLKNFIQHIEKFLEEVLLTEPARSQDLSAYILPSNFVATSEFSEAKNIVDALHALVKRVELEGTAKLSDVTIPLEAAKKLLALKLKHTAVDRTNEMARCIQECQADIFYISIFQNGLRVDSILNPDHLERDNIKEPMNYLTRGLCVRGRQAGIELVSEIGLEILQNLFVDETLRQMEAYALKPMQVFAIFAYTTDAYREANSQLRRTKRKQTIIEPDRTLTSTNTRKISKEVRDLKKLVTTGLAKLPQSGSRFLFRAIMLANLDEDLRNRYLTVGQIIIEESLMSCGIEHGSEGGYDGRITIRKRTDKNGRINSDAKVIMQFSQIRNEGEEVFPPGSRFRILKVSTFGPEELPAHRAKWEITMEELGPETVEKVRGNVKRFKTITESRVGELARRGLNRATTVKPQKATEKTIEYENEEAARDFEVSKALDALGKLTGDNEVVLNIKNERKATVELADHEDQVDVLHDTWFVLWKLNVAEKTEKGKWQLVDVGNRLHIAEFVEPLRSLVMQMAKLRDKAAFTEVVRAILDGQKDDKNFDKLCRTLALPNYDQIGDDIAPYLAEFRDELDQSIKKNTDILDDMFPTYSDAQEKLRDMEKEYAELNEKLLLLIGNRQNFINSNPSSDSIKKLEENLKNCEDGMKDIEQQISDLKLKIASLSQAQSELKAEQIENYDALECIQELMDAAMEPVN
jgi:hypothetical protein